MNYSTVFGRFGKIVKHFNILEAVADDTLSDMVSELATEFATQRPPVANLENDAAQMMSATDTWRTSLVNYARAYLLTSEIADDLRVVTNSVDDVITAMIARMVSDGASINASAVTLGTPTPNAANIGSGLLFASTLLDGVSAPFSSFRARRTYAGLLSEMSVPSETVSLICTADSFSDNRTKGKESFTITGGVNRGQPVSYVTEGTGSGPTFNTVEANTKLTNGDFESFTDDAPNSWTLDAGTAGTHVLKDDADAFRGNSALNLRGDGVLASIALSQSVTVTPLELLVISAWIKADAGIASGTLAIRFTGTGYSAASDEKITILPAALPTSWAHYSAFVVPPANLPSDWKLSIEWTGTPQSAADVFIDSLTVSKPQYHGGVAYAITAGDDDFVRGDEFTITTENSQDGVFQEFFRRAFNCQLPSSGSPTILDSLAQ
jgi:hypothetical protein